MAGQAQRQDRPRGAKGARAPRPQPPLPLCVSPQELARCCGRALLAVAWTGGPAGRRVQLSREWPAWLRRPAPCPLPAHAVAIAARGSPLTPAPLAQKKAVKVLSLSQDKQLYQLLSSGSPSTA